MKARWKWGLLGGIAAVGLAAGFAVAWVLWGPFSFASAAAKVKEEAALLNGRDPQRMLAEANRFYWGHNLPLALPLYRRAEVLFTQTHDPRDALCAKIGVMRTGATKPLFLKVRFYHVRASDSPRSARSVSPAVVPGCEGRCRSGN